MKKIIKIISILTITIFTILSILSLKPVRAASNPYDFFIRFSFKILDQKGNERNFEKAEDLEIIKKELSDTLSLELPDVPETINISKDELINETKTGKLVVGDQYHTGEISKKGISNWYILSVSNSQWEKIEIDGLHVKVLSNETLEKNFDMSKVSIVLKNTNTVVGVDDNSFEYVVTLHEKPKQAKPKLVDEDTQTDETSETITNLQNKIKELENKITEFKTNDTNKTQELEKIKGELQNTKITLENTQKELEKTNLTEKDKESKIAELNNKISNLTNTLDNITKEKTNKEQELSNLQNKIKELENKITEFKTNDTNKTQELEKIKGELQDTKTLLENTQKELEKTNLTEKDKDSKIAELNNKISNLTNTLDNIIKDKTKSEVKKPEKQLKTYKKDKTINNKEKVKQKKEPIDNFSPEGRKQLNSLPKTGVETKSNTKQLSLITLIGVGTLFLRRKINK